jgi:cell division septum initiation protein DivIVA
MSARKLPPERRQPASTAATAARLAEIVEAAEQAAAKVIDEAEEDARRHLEEARERADRIVAERLRELADQLDPPAGAEPAARHLEPVESLAPSPEPDAGPEAIDRSIAAARLLATQMAVSGAGRGEIEARLQRGFDLDDTSRILDAILGPEG